MTDPTATATHAAATRTARTLRILLIGEHLTPPVDRWNAPDTSSQRRLRPSTATHTVCQTDDIRRGTARNGVRASAGYRSPDSASSTGRRGLQADEPFELTYSVQQEA